ncbi:MAG: 30S ribosomal protein S20 [Bacteroidota bacterium]
MPNHLSAAKRVRSSEKKRRRNQYQHKTTKTFVKNLLNTKDKQLAQQRVSKVVSMLDKLVKKGILSWRRAAQKKSKITKYVHQLTLK